MNENELLSQIQKIVNSANGEIKEEIKQLDLKLEQNIAELKEEIKQVDLKLGQEIKQVDLKLGQEIKQVDLKLEQEIKKLNLKLEFDIERKIDIILDYITLQQENESKQNEEIRNLSKRTEHNELKIINCEKRVEILEKNDHLETLKSFN